MKSSAMLVLLISSVQAIGQTMEGTSNTVSIEVGKSKREENSQENTLASIGMTKVPRYYALIIGVAEYANSGPGLPNLDMPVKDAEHFYNVLTEKYSFDYKDVTLLKNPTRDEIVNQFERLSGNVTEKDNLLIFYAGHGTYDKAKDFGFWMPSDAKLASVGSWIPNSTIKDYVEAINSKHTLLITDACFGGSIFKSRSVNTAILQISQIYKDKSRKALTSGNLTEVADKSVFLKFLLKTLEENEQAWLSSAMLFGRILGPISDNSETTPQFGVIQGAGDEGGDFIFFKKK